MQEPPLLYDLTTLQKEANAKHGFTAEKTLSIAQKLYEAKLITYPARAAATFPKMSSTGFRPCCSRSKATRRGTNASPS